MNPVTAKLDGLDAGKQRFAQALDADVVTIEKRATYSAIIPTALGARMPPVYVGDKYGEIEIGVQFVGSDKAEVVRWLRAVANQIEALA